MVTDEVPGIGFAAASGAAYMTGLGLYLLTSFKRNKSYPKLALFSIANLFVAPMWGSLMMKSPMYSAQEKNVEREVKFQQILTFVKNGNIIRD